MNIVAFSRRERRGRGKECEKGLMFRIRKLRVFDDNKIVDMLAIFEGQKGLSQYEPCFV